MPELIDCRVRKRQLASSAEICPHCGDPNPYYQKPMDHWGFVGAVVVVWVSAMILLYLGNPFN